MRSRRPQQYEPVGTSQIVVVSSPAGVDHAIVQHALRNFPSQYAQYRESDEAGLDYPDQVYRMLNLL